MYSGASFQYLDYAYKTTIPEKGETLGVGSYIRWYLNQLEVLSTKVCKLNTFT